MRLQDYSSFIQNALKGTFERLITNLYYTWERTVRCIKSLGITAILPGGDPVNHRLCQGNVTATESIDGLLIVSYPVTVHHQF